MTKLKFNHMLALASTMTLMAGSQTVYAQQTQPTAEIEEVVVTGFRASIENSLAAKQASTSIVETVFAEDIGKLPDTSIAETLARMPGLAGERRGGRTSGISLRGMNEDFVASSMNGRELLGIGDNRGVEYDLYPSEIVSAAVVHKSPDATLLQQGVAGTIELKTLRPLDVDERIISVNANYEQNGLESGNDDFDDNGHRVAATYADQFADSTVGVALTVASLETPSQEEQFRAWGYYGGDADTANSLGGHDSFVRSAVIERDTIAGVVQFQPNDIVNVTVDGLFIDYDDTKVFRGVEEAIASTNPVDSDGLTLAADYGGFHTVIRNDAERTEGELRTVGVNAKFQVSDDWALTLDVANSDSSKTIENIESYSGTGRAGVAGRPANSGSYVLTSKGAYFTASETTPNLADPNLVQLAGPQGWGGSIGVLFPDADGDRRDNAQDGFINKPVFDEELTSVRLEADVQNIEFSIVSSVTFGMNFTDRTKTKDNTGSYLTSSAYFTPEGLAHDFDSGPIPVEQTTEGVDALSNPDLEKYYVGKTNLGFIGLGDIIAYDTFGLVKDGYYKQIPAERYEPGRMGDTYQIDEEVFTTYVKLGLEAGIMTGNVGVQVVNSDQRSSGYAALIGGEDLAVVATPTQGGATYTNLLPSLNLNFQVTDSQKLRLAASKTLTRGRMDDLRASSSINYLFNDVQRIKNDVNDSAWSGGSGNPELKPIEVVQFDTSYEYYFAEDGFLSVGVFYKNLENWHIRTGVETDFSQYIIPGYHDAPIVDPDTLEEFPAISVDGLLSQSQESSGGVIRGTEFQATIPFHLVHESLDGLGLIASAAFMSGWAEGADDNNDGVRDRDRIPGLSKESYQLTVYYEKAGFEFRVSGRERSPFRTQNRGIGLSLTEASDVGATLWDAQVGYNFQDTGIVGLEGLSVSLQVQNLTDEDTVTVDDDNQGAVVVHQHFGANYLLGVNYKF